MSILPESGVQNEELGNTEVVESTESHSHREMWRGDYGIGTNNLCQSWEAGGSLSKLGIMCKEACKFLLIGCSLVATLVIIILSICLSMSGGKVITRAEGSDGSGAGPILIWVLYPGLR